MFNPSGSGVPLIGGPKMSSFAVLTPDQIKQLRGPVQQAIESGANPNDMGAVPLGMLAQVVNTIEALVAEVEELKASQAEGTGEE